MTGGSLRDLHRELQSCQSRLGTTAETAGDFDRALALAHEINNQVAAEYLRVAVATVANPPPTLAALCRKILWPARQRAQSEGTSIEV